MFNRNENFLYSINEVLATKENKGKKDCHNVAFQNETWASISETASSYNLSSNEYLEGVHKLYLRAIENNNPCK